LQVVASQGCAQIISGLTAYRKRFWTALLLIMEGYGRKSTADYVRMLYMAYGSLCELETQIMLAGDLGYFKGDSFEHLQYSISEVERMLKALIRSLENKPSSH
jgi:hypothetical protein